MRQRKRRDPDVCEMFDAGGLAGFVYDMLTGASLKES